MDLDRTLSKDIKGQKATVIEDLVLVLLDFTKTFKVYIDTSDFSILGFLDIR